MRKLLDIKVYLWARTLYLLCAVALIWVSFVYWNAYLYGAVFVLAPWTVLLVAGGAASGQVRRSVYNLLLFGMAGFYMLAALRNGNLSPRGLLLLALGCGVAALAHKAFGQEAATSPRRGILRACLFVAAATLLVLLAATVCRFFGHGDWLPWAAKQAAAQGARSARSAEMLLYSQKRTLRCLATLTYVCGGMLVAGIVPRDAGADHLRREARMLCLLVSVLALTTLAPAVASVFMGHPIEAAWLPAMIGIHADGLIVDRISALQHPNNTAVTAVIAIFCALYCMRAWPRRWQRTLLALACAIYLMALAHTQSRTSAIALGVGAGALAFRQVWLRSERKRRRWGLGLAAWALTMVLVVALVSGVFTVDVFIATRHNAAAESNLLESMRENAAQKKADEALDAPPSDSAVEVADGVMVSRALSAGILNVFSNGRGEVWRDGMDYLIHHPMDMLFGMGPDDIMARMRDYNPDFYHANHLHSDYLEMLARGGIFMLICLLGALCLLARPTARALVAADGPDPGAHIFAALVGVLLMLTLVESVVFNDATVYNLLFFFSAGRVMHAQAVSP